MAIYLRNYGEIMEIVLLLLHGFRPWLEFPMAYLMVKACKLGCCHMTAREAAKFPILLPGKSQSGEKLRVELRHLAFNTPISLE
ncbi:hypothetical protein DAPPUDRAFT_345741 [Daphnia pulex]|uniref:Uncharacterized protein n=1 Tax=Daphnia pulex TaxID=6669 RepID=E9I7K2_DAPPU|nr:hypothetical protein DAPPUDRAFT_345741 [Daphnia pulex]|eukprot:EFX60028.1 hypothetical protein DAPPUDRAFT_345741 [Daphnia pulex]